LPGSNGPLREEAVTYFVSRFGVAARAFDSFLFQERQGEIWATTGALPTGISARRPSGLRILRRTPDGLKPTSAFLTHLGPHIAAGRVDLDRAALESLLLGRRLRIEESDGFFALSLRGDVVGCGRVSAGELQAQIPTGRRRELLLALADMANRDKPIV
jgi:NOL1/NOP2/fmu family ribosome biogenesis protein